MLGSVATPERHWDLGGKALVLSAVASARIRARGEGRFSQAEPRDARELLKGAVCSGQEGYRRLR